jgi:hypothetical protein
MVIGCNATRVPDADFTTLSDLRLVYKIREKVLSVNCPVLVNDKVYDWLQTDKGKTAGLTVEDNYRRPQEIPPMYISSAHYAAMWVLPKHHPEELHIWGCDSLFVDHILSHTDEVVDHTTKRDPKKMAVVARRWRERWKALEDLYPETEFVYHAPLMLID